MSDDPTNLIRLIPAKGGSDEYKGTPLAGVPFLLGRVDMESLRINGRMREFPPGQMPATLSALVEKLGIKAATVVAELDGRIVRPADFSSTSLSDGQAIELVKFMGGG